MQRTCFGRQPARIMLVDLSPPFDCDVGHNVHMALESFMSLTCGITGPTRVPFFGLFALGSYPEVLMPLQHTRANFGRIQVALQELMTACNEVSGCKISSCVTEGLHEAVSMFRRQAQSLLQTAGYWSQLEISIITCRTGNSITKEVEKAVKEITMDSLKKVQIVSISNLDLMQIPEASGASQTSESSNESGDAVGVVDYMTTENDPICLENYLKSWLHDLDTDTEHLHLIFPSKQDEPKLLKCDLQERIISTTILPFPAQYSVHAENSVMKTVPAPGTKAGQSIPVYQLRILKRLPQSAICESVLFGMPLIARATSCWKIDWGELDVNQQNFHALCQLLHQKNEALLAQLHNEPAPVKQGFRYHLPPPQPSGYFILLPSQANTMLVKSVASQELLLPCDVAAPDKPSPDSMTAMDDMLDQVDVTESFNPLTCNSNLYKSLTGQHSKTLTHGKRRTVQVAPVGSSMHGQERGNPSTAAGRAYTNQPTGSKKARFTASGKDFYKGASAFPTEL